MLARSERQLIRASHRANARSAMVPIRVVGGPAGRRGIVVGSIGRAGLATNDVVKVLAVNYVDGMRAWTAAHRQQQRNVSTETHSPDPKPFPLPTTTKQPNKNPSSTARSPSPPPPSLPSQQPRADPSQDPSSDQTVSADNLRTAAASPTESADASSLPSQTSSKSLDNKKEKDLSPDKKDKKLTLWQKVKKEANHYWDGTKLLGKEIRISFRLALKMAAGYELSRRESRQLKRTTEDLIRLVPFSVFVIVPFAELLLPVALKLFPNMLPSTYEGETAREAKRAALSKTRKDVSTFLRTTIQESGLYISKATKQSEAFSEFFKKVRTSGECPSEADVIAISKIFRDDLTLDNLSRAQLMAMCRYMNLNTFGTDTMLRYQLRHHLRQIKRDDKAIAYEGVNSLSVPELQIATAARGIRTTGVSPAHLRDDLQQWLELRLKHGIPSTLLVLSNAYAYGQENRPDSHIENLRTTLSCLTDELFHEAELEVHNAEGAATNKQRLEVLEEQEELIEDENKQEEHVKEATGAATKVKDDVDLDEKEEARRADAEAERAEAAAEEHEARDDHGQGSEGKESQGDGLKGTEGKEDGRDGAEGKDTKR